MPVLLKLEKYTFLVFLFLISVIAVPFNFYYVDLTKFFILTIGVLILLIVWAVNILQQGAVIINAKKLNKIDVFAIIFSLWAIFTSFLSSNPGYSLVGVNYIYSSSIFVFFGMLLYFLSKNNLKSNFKNVVRVIFASSFLVALFEFIHVLKPFSFGTSFSGLADFNLIGSVYDLVLFLILGILSGFLLINKKKGLRMAGIVIGFLVIFASLALINSITVWFIVGVLGIIMLGYSINKDKILSLTLSILTIVLSFIFILIPWRYNYVSKPVFIPYSYDWTVAAKSAASGGVYKFLTGTGPGSWNADFYLYVPKQINADRFFYSSASNPPTFFSIFAEEGYVGLLVYLAFILTALFYGIKKVRRTDSNNLKMVFLMWLIVVLFSFVYSIGTFGWILFWILLSGLAAIEAPQEESRENDIDIVIEQTFENYGE